MVESEKISLRIALMAMDLPRGTYYYTPVVNIDGRKRGLDERLANRLMELKQYELTYGYRKVTVLLEDYNHKKVYRHMKELRMLQPRRLKKRKYTRLPVSCPIGPDIRWEGDLSYVWDGNRSNYLFAVVDTYDKEPIGDYYGLCCRSEEAIHSLEEAIRTRFGNLAPANHWRVTLRLDQGSQYISGKFRRRAKELGVKIEYCGIDCPNDKPYIESFFSRYKCEEVYRNEYYSFAEASNGWEEYKHWYRSKRIHQGLGWMTIPAFKQHKGYHLAEPFLSEKIGA